MVKSRSNFDSLDETGKVTPVQKEKWLATGLVGKNGIIGNKKRLLY